MGNAASKVPYDAQISAVNASLQCHSQNYGTPSLLYASVTAPLVAGAGRDIYFSDLTASFYPNKYFSAVALDIGPYATVNLTVTFQVTNAKPEFFNIDVSHELRFPYPNDTLAVIPFQPAGAVLDPVGPFTLGNGGGRSTDLRIYSVNGNITYNYNFTGAAQIISEPWRLSCVQMYQPFTYIVSSVRVEADQGSPLRPANGVPGVFPPTPAGTRANVANIPVRCRDGDRLSTSNVFNYTISATGPAYVKPGQSYHFDNVQQFLTVPGDLMNNTSITHGIEGQTYLEAIEASRIYIQHIGSNPAYLDTSAHYTASERDTPSPLRTGRYIDGGTTHSVIFPFPNWGHLTLPNTTVTETVGNSIGLVFDSFGGFLTSTHTNKGLVVSDELICPTNTRGPLLSAPVIPASFNVVDP